MPVTAQSLWTEQQADLTHAMMRFKRIAERHGGTQIRLYSQALYLLTHDPGSTGACYGLAVEWCLSRMGRIAANVLDTTMQGAAIASANRVAETHDGHSIQNNTAMNRVDRAHGHQDFRHESAEAIAALVGADVETATVFNQRGMHRHQTATFNVPVIGPRRAARFINLMEGAYMICLPNHAVGAVRRGGRTWFFEPNLGEACFNAGGFSGFLADYLWRRLRRLHQAAFSVDRYVVS